MDQPHYIHDCNKCRFLGNTIGGGRIVDCYVCNETYAKNHKRAPTLIARYSSEGANYCSSPLDLIGPGGHAELWAAKGSFLLTFAEEPWWGQEEAA